MTSLSKDDQLGIVASHQRNLDFNSYNLEVSLIEENAKTTPNSVAIDSLTTQTNEIAAQIASLEIERARVEALSE